jgi:site-specific recombinase XerC
MNATRRFADWCTDKNIDALERVEPFHVAAFIKDLQDELSPPSVKQHLAALRMLFDWLVTGHVIDVNPAHAARNMWSRKVKRRCSRPSRPGRCSTASRSANQPRKVPTPAGPISSVCAIAL